MRCPHSDDGPCPRCAPGVDADASAPTQDDLVGHTLVRGERGGPDVLAAGARIGRYVVLEVLGAGGMGLVYGAYDPVLDRRVAIKVLRAPKGRDARDTEGRARLLREAQAMAQLSHPNVVPVYDVGSEGDAVFVAMELVRGVTLDTWRKQRARPWRQVLDAFLGAGRGLEAAHAAGLVHRDFKPANVLMGDDGRPRVTDFGLARSTRTASGDHHGSGDHLEDSGPVSLETPLTQVGAIMGSPGYMAPEQYEGADTSAATDQYGFCVSLYQALYGQLPFQGNDLSTLSRLAKRAEVPPPPRGSTVPAWLFPVVAKGLAADPAQRHASMAALLAALSKDPARARRWALAVTAGVLASAAGVLGYQWLSQRSARECRATAERLADVWNDDARARTRSAFDATGRSFAQVSWEHASEAMDAYARDWVSARVDACEATRVRGEQSEAQLQLRLSCLDRRLEELSTLADAMAVADAELVGQAPDAVARFTPLQACANLKALEARARLAPAAQEAVANLERQLAQARVLVAMGKLGPARERIGPAVAAAETLAVPAFRGEALQALGELELQSARFTEARAAWERSLEQALTAGDDATAARVLTSMVSLVGWRLERPSEGLLLASLARGVLARMGGDRLVEVALDEAQGDAWWQAGDRAAALGSYRRALDGAIALRGPASNEVARLRSSVGWVLMEQGHLAEARREYEASRVIRERNLGHDHPSLGATWNELGSLASQQGDYASAVAAFERSRVIYQQNLGPAAYQVTREWLNASEDLAADGRVDEAAAALAQARESLAAQPNPAPSARMQFARIQSRVALAQGRHADALAAAREALSMAEQQYGAEHPDSGGCLLALGRALQGAGRASEAFAAFERSRALAERLELAGTRDHAELLLRSGVVLLALRRPGEAVDRFERALREFEALGGNEPLRAEATLGLAEALWTSGADRRRARGLAEDAQRRFVALAREADRRRADAWLAAHPP